jgi:hypothetical protein
MDDNLLLHVNSNIKCYVFLLKLLEILNIFFYFHFIFSILFSFFKKVFKSLD